MAGGGTKLLRSSPCSSSSASHSASSTSLLRPGRIFTWWALTSRSWKARSSSTYQPGFQYGPVASIAMSVTPSSVNQSAISSSAPVKEEKVRVCFWRPRPSGLGVRTQATTSFLPMSIPAQRSISTSTRGLLILDPMGRDRRGQPINDAVKRVRDNSSRCREGPWRQSLRRARAHHAVTSSAGPDTIFILRGGLEQDIGSLSVRKGDRSGGDLDRALLRDGPAGVVVELPRQLLVGQGLP